MTNEQIAKEWEEHAKRQADMWMEEIAQAERVAKVLYIQSKGGGGDQAHVGEVSDVFADKVNFFLPEGYKVENTDEARGWNNYLRLIKQ